MFVLGVVGQAHAPVLLFAGGVECLGLQRRCRPALGNGLAAGVDFGSGKLGFLAIWEP